MNKKHKVAAVLLYVVGALLIVLGLTSLVLPVVPPNVQDFVGQRQEQMDPRWVQLFFGSAKMIGVLYLAIGVTAIILTRMLRRGTPGVRLAIATLLLPYIFIAIVMAPFGLGGPIIYGPVIAVLTGLGLFLSRE